MHSNHISFHLIVTYVTFLSSSTMRSYAGLTIHGFLKHRIVEDLSDTLTMD